MLIFQLLSTVFAILRNDLAEFIELDGGQIDMKSFGTYHSIGIFENLVVEIGCEEKRKSCPKNNLTQKLSAEEF